MINTEVVKDFYDFYSTYEEHIKKHCKDFLNIDKPLDINKDLFQSIIDIGCCVFIIIKEDEEFIGYVGISMTPSLLFQSETHSIIDHIYIVEEKRRQGYFSDVLKEIEKELKSRGMLDINIALPPSVSALAEKHNYTKHACIYKKYIGGDNNGS